MKYIQKEKNRRQRYFLYCSHGAIDSLNICMVRNRKVKKGKHNCVDSKSMDYISHEYLSFGSMKAAVRYVEKNLTVICGQGRYLSPLTSVAIGKDRGPLKIVWCSSLASCHPSRRLSKGVVIYKGRFNAEHEPPFAYNCFVKKPNQNLLKELEKAGRWFERPWNPKSLEDCTLIASKNGGYWLTENHVSSGDEGLKDCGDNHEEFLKRAKIKNDLAC